MKFNFYRYSYKTTNIRLSSNVFENIKLISQGEGVTFGEVCDEMLRVAIAEYFNDTSLLSPIATNSPPIKQKKQIVNNQNFQSTSNDNPDLVTCFNPKCEYKKKFSRNSTSAIKYCIDSEKCGLFCCQDCVFSYQENYENILLEQGIDKANKKHKKVNINYNS